MSLDTTPEKVIGRVGDYLDAIGRPNDPIAQTSRRDANGEPVYPRVKLFAADLAVLLDIARHAMELRDPSPEDFRRENGS